MESPPHRIRTGALPASTVRVNAALANTAATRAAIGSVFMGAAARCLPGTKAIRPAGFQPNAPPMPFPLPSPPCPRHIAPMLSATIIASSSSGNCTLVRSAQTSILVDAGISARRITAALADAGVDPASLDGILITHEHCDHVGGLPVFLKRFGIPVFCNSATAAAAAIDPRYVRSFLTRTAFSLGDIAIETFEVPHDAADPVGFTLRSGGASLGFVTDLGYPTAAIRERIRGVHTLLVEANHDERLLQNDLKRPWAVKQRIMSRHGHLSNDAAARLVAEIAGDGLRRVVLGHLSRDCNTPDLALAAISNQLALAAGIEVHCAAPDAVSASFEIPAAAPTPAAAA